MPRTRLRHGTLPVVMLVVVILWALAAVLMLTTTLINAYQIDNRVGVINNVLRPIDKDLDAVVLSNTTAELARQISRAADPLTSQLKVVDESVQAIDGSGKSILKNAQKINAAAKSVNSKVKSINSSVKSINSTANSINSNVRSIGSSLSSVGGKVSTINASARGIDASFGGTLSNVQSIDDSVSRANSQILTVLPTVRGIKGDTGTIRMLVPRITYNARAIEGNPLLLSNLQVLGLLGVVPSLPGNEPAARPNAGATDNIAQSQTATTQPAPQSSGGDSVIGGVIGGVGGLLNPAPVEEGSAPPREPSAPPAEAPVVSGTGGLLGSLLGGG